MYIGLHLQDTADCPILMKLGFSRQFPKNIEIHNFIKLNPVGTEFFHADGMTDGNDEA